MNVYDTQCGAKTWVFDVELIQRLLQAEEPLGEKDFVEVPLSRWVDVSGSKLRLRHGFRVAWDLARLTVKRS